MYIKAFILFALLRGPQWVESSWTTCWRNLEWCTMPAGRGTSTYSTSWSKVPIRSWGTYWICQMIQTITITLIRWGMRAGPVRVIIFASIMYGRRNYAKWMTMRLGTLSAGWDRVFFHAWIIWGNNGHWEWNLRSHLYLITHSVIYLSYTEGDCHPCYTYDIICIPLSHSQL